MASPRDSPESPEAATPQGQAIARRGWRGDEHRLQADAAGEVGLDRRDVEVDLYTEGFKSGTTIQDAKDGAIVLRGRTVLKAVELKKAMRPMLQYVGVALDAVQIRVHDGTFEVRIASRAAEASQPALGGAKIALKLWLGFGLLGLAAYTLLPTAWAAVAAVLWGVGLLLGAWQLRTGMVGGRAMLAARLAMGLAMLAHEQQLVLPPAAGDQGP